MRRNESLNDVSDIQAVNRLRRIGVDVERIEARIVEIEEIGRRYGAPVVIADGIRAVMRNGRVVTVLERCWRAAA
jgi:hypothetical protein